MLANFRRHVRSMSFIYLVLVLLGTVMVLPIVFLVSTAFKPVDELFIYPPTFFVKNPTIQNFADLLQMTSSALVPISRYFFNSLLVSVITVAFTVVLSSLAAYPLAKHQFFGKDQIFGLVVASLMFAPEVVEIPRYLIITFIGLSDTYAAMIMPHIAFPIGLFLMKQFLEQIPDAIFEAGKIDGANEWTLFTKLALPLVRPAWATVVILAFTQVWNDASSPALFIQSESLRTLPYYLSTINGAGVGRAGAAAAATFIMVMPTILIFILFQRKVISTMAYSGIKS